MKLILSVLLLTFMFISCSKDEHGKHKVKKEERIETYYTCSMHPQIREKKPGKCPICGMGLTKIEIEHDEEDTKSIDIKEEQAVYYCKDNPEVISEAPGECPLDGTPMLKKESTNKNEDVIAKVKLRKSQVRHFKADLFSVTIMKMQKKIRLLGTLVKSERKESNIPARVAGRVEKVLVESTGSFIKVGDPVLKLYSPILLTGGEEYIIARKNYYANRKSKAFRSLLKQSTQRMKLWGVLESQLETWAKKNKVPREITIYSPVTGIVEKKNAIEGRYFKEGQSFFNLVDLSTLWVELDVYEHDSALVKLGQNVEIEFSAYPGDIWNGQIDFINPVLNTKTRTLKIRTTLKNNDGKLRPGMVGTSSVTLELDKRVLVIPRTAIIDTGKRKVVWIDAGKNTYQAKKIHTGFESEGYVEIKHGLMEGEKVVIEGNFLLDAQAQLFGGYEDGKTSSGHKH